MNTSVANSRTGGDARAHGTPDASRRLWTVLGVLNLAVPVVLAAIICLRTAVNIPLTDDYDCIGGSMESVIRLNGFWPRLWFVLTAQHVQYKLMFLNSIVALQYYITGHTNYKVLQYMGDLSIFGVVTVLWFVLARSGRPFVQRLWLFTVPCYTYLAIRYYETINWAMSGLQNLAILPFAATTLLFLTSRRRSGFVWSMIFLVISIATSGNGFFVAIIAIAYLLWSRRLRDAAIAVAVITPIAVLYAYHYHVYAVAPPLPLRAALASVVQFPFLFLGAWSHRTTYALPLGTVLLGIFLWLARKGWYRLCPGSFLMACFCIVTAVAVTGTRYRMGPSAALADRYVMYSLLLISVEFIGFLRTSVPQQLTPPWRTTLLAMGAVSVVICLKSDAYAWQRLEQRKQVLITHLILWERHPDLLIVSPDEDKQSEEPDWVPLVTRFQRILRANIAHGIYVPPYSASDPLPIRTHSPGTRAIEDEPAPARPATR